MTYEIISNAQAMTITVGECVYTHPSLWRTPEKDTFLKQEICGVAPWHDGPKAAYRFLAERLGPAFNRRFQAANYWLWIGHRMEARTGNLFRNEGRHWSQYSDHLVERANNVLPYVNEAERDGLHHLIPAIVLFQASPQAIRNTVGQGPWRRYTHNSISRNTRIMNAVLRHSRTAAATPDMFTRLLDMPSGVLRGVWSADDDEVIAARITPRKTVQEFQRTVHIVRDTRQMLGRAFNPAWGFHRMEEEHRSGVRGLRRARYSDIQFADAWSFQQDGFTASLLTSELDIATEGDVQHHCVGGYSKQAAKGRYAVFAIEGKERATAGFTTGPFGVDLDQVYGACNSFVSPECLAFTSRLATEYGASRRRVAA